MERTERMATVVERHTVWKFCPRQAFDLQDVMEEVNYIVGCLPDMLHFGCLFHGCEVIAYLVGADA